MSVVLWESLNAWWAEAILSFGALLVILFSARPVSRDGSEHQRPADGALWVAWVTLALSAVALAAAPVPPATGSFFGFILCDGFSLAFRWFALGSVGFALLLVMASRELSMALRGECIGLLLLIGVGLMLMAEANHLLMAYLSMELVSLSSYLLVGFLNEPRSAEASLKYLLFGALSSGIMLFGMSLLFGATGAMSFPEIQRVLIAADPAITGVLLLAVSLMLAGLAFKISMVPFHLWTPDAYEGAPIAVAALLSVGPKAAGLALLIRVTEALKPLWPQLGPILFVLTVVTMTFGNLVALAQTNVKRLLAYSTIGQVGYLLIGFVVNSSLGREAMFAYLIAYLFMNYGIFACLLAVVNETGNESLDAFRGLATRSPGLALLCALFLLSLAGIPPMLGFFGKLLLFGAALEAQSIWLAVAGIVNSAIALYYYVNLIRLMYFVEPQETTPIRPAAPLRWAMGLCAAATIVLGLFPGALLSLLGVVDSVALPPALSADRAGGLTE